MNKKFLITGGAVVFGTLGGYIGSLMDGGFGLWSILFSTLGGFLGIWLGFKLANLMS